MNLIATNRKLLKYMADLLGIEQTAEDMADHLRAQGIDPAFVPQAAAYLEEAGFLVRCEKTVASKPAWRVTAEGVRQAKQQVPASKLDPMIWGT